MAKRSTKKPKTAEEKPRAFLFAKVTASLISETLAEMERIDRVKPDPAPPQSPGPEQTGLPSGITGPGDAR